MFLNERATFEMLVDRWSDQNNQVESKLLERYQDLVSQSFLGGI